MTKQVTKKQGEAVLGAVKEQFKSWLDAGYDPPVLVMEFTFLGGEAVPTIVWEEGPYDWSMFVPGGGVEEEFGFTIKEVELPDGVFAEAMTGWALGIYPTE